MAKKVKLRRGTTAQHASFTGAVGEVTVDTDKDVAVVHDGSTAGGFPMARSDRARGYTKIEHFTASGTYTKNDKPDLKRIEVWAYGGGGGGANNTSGGSGGGSGGIGYVILDASSVTSNVTVTVGSGGATGVAGGTTTFGSYITANGGTQGASVNFGAGIVGGNATGSGVIDIGGFASNMGAYSATANANYGWTAGSGGGFGGGGLNTNNGAAASAHGVLGGGASAGSGPGSDGSVIIHEVYGE